MKHGLEGNMQVYWLGSPSSNSLWTKLSGIYCSGLNSTIH